MKLQDSQANCGALAVYNALRALGIERSTEELGVLLKTDATTGTSCKNMVKGCLKIEDLHVMVIEEKHPVVAELYLYHALRNGRPVVMVVDEGEHWIAAIGLLGHRVLVADSANESLVMAYSKEEMMARWCDVTKKPYYGVQL